MKKAKQFIVGSTIALFLSSSTLAGAATYRTEQHRENSTIQKQVLVPKKDRYQKKMYYKQLMREKKERQMNS